MLLDSLKRKKDVPLETVKEEEVEDAHREIPADILAKISMMNLQPNEMVIVTFTTKTVTKERQDPITGSKELLSRDTINTHKLSLVRKGF
jgi:hypothetical protein